MHDQNWNTVEKNVSIKIKKSLKYHANPNEKYTVCL